MQVIQVMLILDRIFLLHYLEISSNNQNLNNNNKYNHLNNRLSKLRHKLLNKFYLNYNQLKYK